ncbi:MAG: alpha/beta hydrolase [Bacteroidota bacterium]
MKYLFTLAWGALVAPALLAQSSVADRLQAEDTQYRSSNGVKVEAQKGTFDVPENRNNPESETISISFIRLKSKAENPQAPLVYLSGGPGSSCTWQAENPRSLKSWLPYLELGDVIFVDQRGTGAGQNRVISIYTDGLPSDVLVSEDRMKDYYSRMIRYAQQDLAERRVDLEGYTSVQNAEDIDELRQALGIEKISLFGFSYGTHLGQTYIKYHEAHVEKAILVGVEGLNHTFKLPSTMDVQMQKLALLVQNDPQLSQEVPDLMALYLRVCEKLDANPAEIEVTNPLTEQPMTVKLGSYGLNLMMRFDIGDASDLPVFPRLLYGIDQGDYSALTWFVRKRINNFYGVSGMSLTMDEASGATPSRFLQIEEQSQNSDFGGVTNFSMGWGWEAPDLGEEFRAPLVTSVPTLFMSGTLDFNTPPHQAEEVRWGFANSHHIVVGYAGHEQITTHPGAQDAMIGFLKGDPVNEIALSYPPISFIPVTGKPKRSLSHPSVED